MHSTKQVESLTGINSVSVTHYENENRDIKINNLKKFADLYNVSIDYILCYSNDGIFVFYEKDNKRYSLNEKTFQEYHSQGLIYYKDNKRYLDINY